MSGVRIAAMNLGLERAATAVHLDLGQVPNGEPAVFARLSLGMTESIPFVSANTAEWVRAFAPRSLMDLAAALALDRPAPVELGVAGEFLRCRVSGRAPPLHPRVDDLLAETMGFAIYYDQVDRCLAALAGVPRELAEPWRRQMMRGGVRGEDGRQGFLTAAREGGDDPRHLEAASLAMLRFARIAYPRAEADAMALFAYRMTWLQLHHPDVVRWRA